MTIKEGIENIWRQRSCTCLPKLAELYNQKGEISLHVNYALIYTFLKCSLSFCMYCLTQVLWFSSFCSVFYISDILTLKSLHIVYGFFFLRYFAISNGSVFFLVTIPVVLLPNAITVNLHPELFKAQFSSVQFSCSVVSDSLRPHE